LSQDDPYFHPYHHNDAWHHFDAAYHNGTVWGWNAGFTVTALCRVGQAGLAWKLAENLASQVLQLGCRGSMSELIEAVPRKNGQLVLSGTWAQAWSTSEFARNAYQDFGGFHPRLLDGALHLHPHLPKAWTEVEAVYPFGRGARLRVNLTRWGRGLVLHARMEGHDHPLSLHITLEHAGRRLRVKEPLLPGVPVVIELEGKRARINNGKPVETEAVALAKPLRFRTPSLAAKPRAIREKHYLQTIIEAGRYR
jgi:hypothetical protein